MSDWERAGGTPRWSKPPLLEAVGELSIDSPGTPSIRGRGVVVAVAPDPSTGTGHLHWLIKKAFQSTPTTGWIQGNLIRGHYYDGSVLVVRYERLVVEFEQMQLAFRGPEARQLAAVLTNFAAARTAFNEAIEMADAADEDAKRRASRELDEHELAEAGSMFGEIIRWDDPDDEARDDSQCSLADQRANDSDECLSDAAEYYLRGQQLARDPDIEPESEEWDESSDDFVFCARCLREIIAARHPSVD